MEQMSVGTLLAVFEEMFSPALFWALVAAAVLFTAAFVFILLRDRGLRSGRFLRDELFAIFGGIAAIAFVQFITNSGFGDIGGPIDVILVLAIWAAGAVGTVMVLYVLQGLLLRN